MRPGAMSPITSTAAFILSPMNGPQDHVPGSPAAAGRPALRCPLCGCLEFQREESRQESRWGFTSHRMTLMICAQCRFVMHFYDKHSMWNLD